MSLSLTHISKKYAQRSILSDVTVSLQGGELCVIMGRSGAGKTTLLRLIAGLEHPDSGEIRLGDAIVYGDGRCIEPYRRNMGFIFQELALWPHLTVEQHCDIVLKGKIKVGGYRREKIYALLERLQIVRYARSYPHTLSAGEKQRVALARALVTDPQILLLDEPLTYLDVHLRKDIIQLIKEMNGELKMTMLYVTHLPDEALLLGGKTGILENGRIDTIGDVHDIVEKFVRGD